MIETVVITNKNNISSISNNMNLKGNVLISQQIITDENSLNVFNKGRVTKVVSNTKGIGVNRSLALFYSTGDICVLADDDMIFYDDYIQTVQKAYEDIPDADIIIFDLNGRETLFNSAERPYRVRWYNYMRFGAARFSFRREVVLKHGIGFNRYFGASVFGSGEDTLFLRDCLKKGLKIYYYPKSLASLTKSRKSTWFEGFNEKYYFDKGALYYALSPLFYRLLLLRHIIKTRYNRRHSLSFCKAYKLGVEGARFFDEIGSSGSRNMN